MKITKKNNVSRFEDITVGTIFKYNTIDGEKIYIKGLEVRKNGVIINTMELGEYYFTTFTPDTLVDVVEDAELIV